MNKYYSIPLASALLVLLLGCEEDKTEAASTAVEPAIAEPPRVAPPQPSPEELKATEEAAAKKAEEEKQQAEVEENPLTECCRALGKQAFTLRSPEYHGASKVCGEGLTEKKELAAILPDIKKALKDKTLPDECAK